MTALLINLGCFVPPPQAVWYSGRPSFQLLLCQLHRMLQDCAIPNRVLPLAAIDVLVAKTRREHPAILKLRRGRAAVDRRMRWG